MKSEELAFVNRQLAAMLKSGIPLEGALRQLCREMRRGRLRNELGALEADLARGIPLDEALAVRHLPELYVRMLRAGARSQDLPGMLILLADYYYQQNNFRTRLSGMLIYPVIVLMGCLFLSGLCATIFSGLIEEQTRLFSDMIPGARLPAFTRLILDNRQIFVFGLWLPASVLALAIFGFLAILLLPPIRRMMRFYLPVLKEASCAQFASTMGLMLKGGCSLSDSLAYMGRLEAGNSLGRELDRWQERLRNGAVKFTEIAQPGKLFPPLFNWLVAGAGEDLPEGFRQAAELYAIRAQRGRDFVLHAALPAVTVILGMVIAIQVYCLAAGAIGMFLPLANMIGF